nr:TIGR04255 family protein [uncultured Flavobacterium sp.]
MFKPISETHSVSKIVANIFSPQYMIKAEDVFMQLNNKFQRYQRRGLTSSNTINLENDTFAISNDGNTGFIFEKFNTQGKSINLFKVENIPGKNKTQIIFESKEYTNWSNFITDFINDLNEFISINNIYVEAISLNFIDEFIWESNEKIPVEQIFNNSSDLLNTTFLNSHNGTLVFISQSERKSNQKFYEEKTELLFNNDIKRVVINHIYAIQLEEIKKVSNDLIIELFETAHSKNKDLLQAILTKHIKSSINLK